MIDHSRKEFRDRPLDVICKKTQSRGHSRSLKFKNFNDCSYSAVDIIYKPRDHKNIATSKTFYFLIGKENCYRYPSYIAVGGSGGSFFPEPKTMGRALARVNNGLRENIGTF